MAEPRHLTTEQLEAGLESIRQSPRNDGVLEMIVRRPSVGEREVVQQGELRLRDGLVGDSWATRGCPLTPDGSAHPDMQLNVMNARALALVAQDKARWQLAGDELIVDLDLSEENLPAGTRLAIGSAIIEVTAQPHTGCEKFAERFGADAVRFVNSPLGKRQRLRGLNARVVEAGVIRTGDVVRKV
ncbi:MAG: MOSC domain-containing protein [Planctomycetes bacterium]|nr:MOSC domain-containing protein [Planctomycetota bacterium]